MNQTIVMLFIPAHMVNIINTCILFTAIHNLALCFSF